MGYTHYWQFHNGTPIDEDTRRVCSKLKEAVEFAIKEGYDIAGYDGSGEPRLEEMKIGFNGRGDDHHETFLFHDPDGFNFCKTARKPYDAVVCLCLLVMKDSLGSGIRVSSDGDWDEWSEGRKLYKEFTGKDAPVPWVVQGQCPKCGSTSTINEYDNAWFCYECRNRFNGRE